MSRPGRIQIPGRAQGWLNLIFAFPAKGDSEPSAHLTGILGMPKAGLSTLDRLRRGELGSALLSCLVLFGLLCLVQAAKKAWVKWSFLEFIAPQGGNRKAFEVSIVLSASQMGEFLVETQGHRQFCSQEINFPVCLAAFCPAGMSWRSCWAVAFSATPAPGTQGMYGHGAGAVSSTSIHLGTGFYQPAELFVALGKCFADLCPWLGCLSCQGSQTQSPSLGGAVLSEQQTLDVEQSLDALVCENIGSLFPFLLHFFHSSPTYIDSNSFTPFWKWAGFLQLDSWDHDGCLWTYSSLNLLTFRAGCQVCLSALASKERGNTGWKECVALQQLLGIGFFYCCCYHCFGVSYWCSCRMWEAGSVWDWKIFCYREVKK